MSEIPWWNFESNENILQLKQATPEEVNKVKDDIGYSNKHIKVNNVLNVLDFPDNIEEKFRKVLEKQDDNTLIELAKKQKLEILSFFKNTELNINNKENKKNESKFSKIQSVFTPKILANNPKIAKKFEELDLLEGTEKKDVKLQEILAILKEPWILNSIINDLGWADKNNPSPQYLEFKNTLIDIDPSFKLEFDKLEGLNAWYSLNTSEVIKSIEKESWWLVSVDLNSDTPVSKLGLVGSDYNFSKKIDKEALSSINEINIDKLAGIQNSFAVLKGLYTPFDGLINNIKQNWDKQDLKEVIKGAISNFPRDVFSDTSKMYEEMNIDSSIQITESDMSSFSSVNSPNELRIKIENIQTKFQKIQSHIWAQHAWILKQHKTNIKELVERESQAKEKQKEVLEFMKISWFDLIPKNITDKIIRELQGNTLTIPWLELNVKNIDLENGHFWESGAFIDKEAWINIASKINLVKFVNKIISWNIDEPLSAEAIANWVSIADPNFLKHKFSEADIVGGMGWKYNGIIENLKKAS